MAPQGPQTFRIDAGITPNARFQKTCFFTLGQIWLQNGVQKKVPRDPFGYLGAPSGLLCCLFGAPLDSLCNFLYKRDANPSQNVAQGPRGSKMVEIRNKVPCDPTLPKSAPIHGIVSPVGGLPLSLYNIYIERERDICMASFYG